MSSNLRETVFHIEKLRNIVGVGNCSAYQIWTEPGKAIGRIGRVAGDEIPQAANPDVPETAGSNEAAVSWFTRMLSALKS